MESILTLRARPGAPVVESTPQVESERSRADATAVRPRFIGARPRNGFETLARWWTRGRRDRLTIAVLKQQMLREVSRYVDSSVL